MLSNCLAREDSWESLGLKQITQVNPKGNQSWILIGRTDNETEAPILWPPNAKIQLIRKVSVWERLKVGGEGNDRGWDGWMTSLTQWTWVWASSRRWWRTGWPGMLQSMGLQRVWHDWGTEQQQNQTKMSTKKKIHIKDYNFKNDGFLSSWFQGKKMSVRSVLHMHFWSLFF